MFKLVWQVLGLARTCGLLSVGTLSPGKRLIADMAPIMRYKYVALMLFLLQHVLAAVGNYASVRHEVQKAYAQQTEEIARAVANLQSVSTETAAAIHEIETKCG